MKSTEIDKHAKVPSGVSELEMLDLHVSLVSYIS
jgi:hypothetical protein